MDHTYTLGADKLGKLRDMGRCVVCGTPGYEESYWRRHVIWHWWAEFASQVSRSSTPKAQQKLKWLGQVTTCRTHCGLKISWKRQGHKIWENYFEQDNESAIKLEKNGRLSAGPRSRHINIRYFWIKDRVKDANVNIRHCPTIEMLGDFFTKPLPGKPIQKIQGCDPGLPSCRHPLSRSTRGRGACWNSAT
jgi:hypothetical protein